MQTRTEQTLGTRLQRVSVPLPGKENQFALLSHVVSVTYFNMHTPHGDVTTLLCETKGRQFHMLQRYLPHIISNEEIQELCIGYYLHSEKLYVVGMVATSTDIYVIGTDNPNLATEIWRAPEPFASIIDGREDSNRFRKEVENNIPLIVDCQVAERVLKEKLNEELKAAIGANDALAFDALVEQSRFDAELHKAIIDKENDMLYCEISASFGQSFFDIFNEGRQDLEKILNQHPFKIPLSKRNEEKVKQLLQLMQELRLVQQLPKS